MVKLREQLLMLLVLAVQQQRCCIEQALGEVKNQELLPEYYEGKENLTSTQNQSIQQKGS